MLTGSTQIIHAAIRVHTQGGALFSNYNALNAKKIFLADESIPELQ